MKQKDIVPGLFEGPNGDKRQALSVNNHFSDGVPRVNWYPYPVHPGVPGYQTSVKSFARWAVRLLEAA